MPPYPGDPPEWRTFSGSYLDWQPSDEGSSTVTALTTENERLRAELASVREELAAARGRADRRDSDRLTHYEWLGRYLALPRRQHRGIMRWVVEHVWRMLAGAKQKFDDTLINWEKPGHIFSSLTPSTSLPQTRRSAAGPSHLAGAESSHMRRRLAISAEQCRSSNRTR
ncbi:hypothetical protein D6D15_01976 [Aureobasidium pullulans]|uniref:Uncharacterized protein n=1 Tax=Aureobasidium pullulans TaxID=5580 RepID=A0A4S9BM49_AURPU|nr:hypothetical protein D6D15_01976 [Aureobasidium pullulans]